MAARHPMYLRHSRDKQRTFSADSTNGYVNLVDIDSVKDLEKRVKAEGGRMTVNGRSKFADGTYAMKVTIYGIDASELSDWEREGLIEGVNLGQGFSASQAWSAAQYPSPGGLDDRKLGETYKEVLNEAYPRGEKPGARPGDVDKNLKKLVSAYQSEVTKREEAAWASALKKQWSSEKELRGSSEWKTLSALMRSRVTTHKYEVVELALRDEKGNNLWDVWRK